LSCAALRSIQAKAATKVWRNCSGASPMNIFQTGSGLVPLNMMLTITVVG
jgi:hypothetical protein